MHLEVPQPWSKSRHMNSLRHQLSEGSVSERLVVLCEDPVTPNVFERDLKLRVLGLRVDDPEVLEAVRYAVERLGVSEIIVLGHTGCSHADPPRVAPWPGSVASPQDRLLKGLERSRTAFEHAKRSVKQAVHTLRTSRAHVPPACVTGLLWSETAGVHYHYGAEESGFRLVPGLEGLGTMGMH